jgi:hypothetical protein
VHQPSSLVSYIFFYCFYLFACINHFALVFCMFSYCSLFFCVH